MNTNFNIGSRLYELRTNLNLSQEQLALRAEITTTYLGQIEHNAKRPTVHVIEKICSALDITLYDFFYSENLSSNHDALTNEILFYLQDCSDYEKEFILTMCKHLKLLQHDS